MFNQTNINLGKERSVIREIFEYANARKKEIGAENVFDFSLGNPSVPAPECVRKEIGNLINNTSPETLHGYTSAAGAPEVRAAVADYIAKSFDVPMRPELVYMTCGAAASLTATLNALCNAGDEVIVIAPYFPEYRVFIEAAGATVVTVRADANFHLDLEAISRAVGEKTKAIIINSPNNPTGAVYCAEELAGLAALLKSVNAKRNSPVYLIADEPYRELVYGAKVPYPMCHYPNTVLCYSFSKSLSLAGERIGYVAVHPDCIGAEELFFAICGAGRALGYVCAPALFQRVVAKCLGKSSDINVYKRNRDLLYDALTEYGFSCVRPEGAFYLFVQSPEADAKAFSERAKRHELLIVPSDSFGITGYARVSYCVDGEMIERSLPAFQALAKEYCLKG